MASWDAGELLVYAAWGGTLIYAGALFMQNYGLGPALTGVMLPSAGAAYMPGNLLCRRWVGHYSRLLLITIPVAMAACVALFGGLRPSI